MTAQGNIGRLPAIRYGRPLCYTFPMAPKIWVT